MRVAVSHGLGRRGNITKCLRELEGEIRRSLSGYNRILVKPNMVSAFRRLSATHVEGLDAVIGFLRRLKPNVAIVVGEIPAVGSFKEGCGNYGYEALREKYDVKLEPLEGWPEINVRVFDGNLSTFRVPVVNPKGWYIVSVSPPKTHDTVLVTLSMKNIAMGLVKKMWRSKLHQGYKAINLSLYRLSRFVRANLAVIDGYEAMEGDGPVNGTPLVWDLSIAGLDPVIVDAATSWLMGINPWNVGYIYYALTVEHSSLGMEDLIMQIGHARRLRRTFKLHRTSESQYEWRLEDKMYKHVKPVLLDRKP